MEKRRTMARFGLRTMLVAMLVLASSFASYHYGLNRGRTLGPMVPTNLIPDTVYTREYDVSDLVTSASDAEMVLNGLRESIEPTSWAVAGGCAEIQFNTDSGSFIVDQTWLGHFSVARYLSFLREHTTEQQDWKDMLDFAQKEFAKD